MSTDWLRATVLGGLISFSLFWLMQFMITNDQAGLRKSDNSSMVEFVRLKRDSRLREKDRRMPESPEPKKRPPPPKMTVAQPNPNPANKLNLDMPNLDIPLQSDRFHGSMTDGLQIGAGQGQLSGNLIPLVRIAPRYPMRAQTRKIEGWVKIEFTITEDGTVKDPEVVEAQPVSIFDRAALRAILKWKFKPELENGVAIERRAVQLLEFKLAKSR